MSDTEAPAPATPQAGTATAAEVKFTEKEERVLKVVWGCMKTLPEVDMAKLTHAAQFQTLKTCQNTWGQIKKKLMAQAMANGVEIMSPAKAPKTPASTPKKRGKPATDEVAEDEVDGVETATPTKAKKSRKVKREPIKEEREEGGTSPSEGGETVKKEEDVQMDDGAVFGAQ